MREAMYGFMTLHLKGEGTGDPIPEPAIKTEDPEDLRCYPGNTRPKDFMTIPKFAAREGKRLREAAKYPGEPGSTQADGERAESFMRRYSTGVDVQKDPYKPQWKKDADGVRTVAFVPQLGVKLVATVDPGKANAPIVVLLDLNGAEAARKSDLYAALRRIEVRTITLDLRATGKLAAENERVERAPDHNSAEWGLWCGRPLLIDWQIDMRWLVSALRTDAEFRDRDIIVIGRGPAALVAALAGLEEPYSRIAMVDTLASFVTAEPYLDQRLGIINPDTLRDLGDVAHLALGPVFNPKGKLVIAGGMSSAGKPLTMNELKAAYAPALRAAKQLGHESNFVITTPDNLLKELGLTEAR
jgi:hypothetical protein